MYQGLKKDALNLKTYFICNSPMLRRFSFQHNNHFITHLGVFTGYNWKTCYDLIVIKKIKPSVNRFAASSIFYFVKFALFLWDI